MAILWIAGIYMYLHSQYWSSVQVQNMVPIQANLGGLHCTEETLYLRHQSTCQTLSNIEASNLNLPVGFPADWWTVCSFCQLLPVGPSMPSPAHHRPNHPCRWYRPACLLVVHWIFWPRWLSKLGTLHILNVLNILNILNLHGLTRFHWFPLFRFTMSMPCGRQPEHQALHAFEFGWSPTQNSDSFTNSWRHRIAAFQTRKDK